MLTDQKLLAAGSPQRPLSRGCHVRLWTNEFGTFVGWTRDGWCRVRVDNETRIDEWQHWQLESLGPTQNELDALQRVCASDPVRL